MGQTPQLIPELSLDVAEKELRYAASKHAIELISKDEDIRRLRAELFISEDDTEELRDQLQHEQESADRIRQLVDEHLVRAQDAEALLATNDQELGRRDHELQRLHTEVQSLRSTTQDASSILAEKLSLARELSTIRPELEHFKAQQATLEDLRSENLALQRQLADAQCEIEASRAEAKRAQARRRNTTFEIAQEEQVAELKKALANERRLRANAEDIAQNELQSDDVRRELVKERNLREKLEQEIELLKENTEIEDIRRDLARAHKARHRLQDEVDTLQVELEREKKAADRAMKMTNGNAEAAALAELTQEFKLERELRTNAERNAIEREQELETGKTELEDKLNQFRSKLREKKEELRSTKAELATAKEQLDKAEASIKAEADLAATKAVAKRATTKRNVPTTDEATLGTPGNGPSTKKSRPAAIGDKSSFSITPFLNKTANLNDDDAEKSELEPSPITNRQTTKVPLAPAASIKTNRQPKKNQRQCDKKNVLAAVAEESEPVSKSPQHETVGMAGDNAATTEVLNDKPVVKRKQKPRKSLTDFKSFHKDDEPVKQKKRRLGGRGPTLFDDDDNDDGAVEAKASLTGRELFGPAAYAKLASSKKAIPGVRNSTLGRSIIVGAPDGSGFQFSPLKRSRKKLDDTLKG